MVWHGEGYMNRGICMKRKSVTMLYLDECPNCGAPRGNRVSSCPYCGTSLLNMKYPKEEAGQADLFDGGKSRTSMQEELQGVKDVIISKAIPHTHRDRTVLIVAMGILSIIYALIIFFLFSDFEKGKVLALILGLPLLLVWYFCIGEFRVCTKTLQAAEQDPMYKSKVAMIGERVKVTSINPDGGQFRELYVIADIRGRKTCINILVEDGSSARLARLYPIGSKFTIGGSGEYFVQKVL